MPANKKSKSKPRTQTAAVQPAHTPLTWGLAVTFSLLTVVFVGQVFYYFT